MRWCKRRRRPDHKTQDGARAAPRQSRTVPTVDAPADTILHPAVAAAGIVPHDRRVGDVGATRAAIEARRSGVSARSSGVSTAPGHRQLTPRPSSP
jgi:hypothetical protein